MSKDEDVLKLLATLDGFDVEITDAANFFAAESGSGAALHRHAREAKRCLQDAYMRIGADSASTGDVTPAAIRDTLYLAVGHLRRAFVALNDDLRTLSERLP